MPEGYLFNPANPSTVLAPVQISGTLLFCAVFLFLWRRSRVAYFGFWSLAWAVEALAVLSGFAANWRGWLLLRWCPMLLEFFFALAVLTAARTAATATSRGFRSSIRAMLPFPGLLLAVYLFAWRIPLLQFRELHAAILALIYGYSFFYSGVRSGLRTGVGGMMMRFALACLFLNYLGCGLAYFYNSLGWIRACELVPQTLLAFSAMAIWFETQQETITQLRIELDSLEKATTGSAELDHLTGLQNRMALDRYLDEPFTGVVAVCDMDYFKDINDRFGHLVGDDVLRSVGHLIRSSIRAEDDAFRWGGDEFVIVFRNQHIDLVLGRMAVIEERLQAFRIRGHGLFPLGVSWGAAEGNQRVLRPVLEEADLQMYERKRQARAGNA